ncbi:MAG: transporter [Gemmatimonadaceae bacterium]
MRLSFLLSAAVTIAATAAAQQTPPPIRDNSFLIEEAYNQEPGVVQHILLFGRDRATRDWELGFTQEWPFISQNHQLSYTVALVRAGENRGIGDVALNYRYRWLAGERSESVIRLSALLPTGNAARGLGAGGAGVQVNLPVSLAINRSLAAHWNMGGSLIPSARAEDGSRSSVREVFGGASVIWLVHPALNFLTETIWSRAEAPGIGGTQSAETSLTLVPGLRGAINLRSGAQIVPGVGLMLDAKDGARVSGLLLYLSFEHAFGGIH